MVASMTDGLRAVWQSDDPADIMEAFCECRAFGPKRISENEFDFGDDATILKQLKRVGVDWYHADHDQRAVFGVFGGNVKGLWVVWVFGHQLGRFYLGLSSSGVVPARIRLVLGYDGLDALKADWQLD